MNITREYIIAVGLCWATFVNGQSTGSWDRVLSGYLNGTLANIYDGGADLDWPVPKLYDIDSDGDLDLFVGSFSGELSMFRNDGVSGYPAWSSPTKYTFEGIESCCAPAFCDIDNDSRVDLFLGELEGAVYHYQNTGSPSEPIWTLIETNYNNMDVGRFAAPAFCDIDADGDQDMFVGSDIDYIDDGVYRYNTLTFFENTGSITSPAWADAVTNYNGIFCSKGVPAFVDIDGDADYDLYMGSDSAIAIYENTGTVTSAAFEDDGRLMEDYEVTAPTFGDIDADGDQDLVLGFFADHYIPSYYDEIGIALFENTGTVTSASWAEPWSFQNNIDVGFFSAPTFGDIDGDVDFDLLIGHASEYLSLYKNTGTPAMPCWSIETRDYLRIGDIDNSGRHPFPCLVDIDADGDQDLFVSFEQSLFFYENTGSLTQAYWDAPTTNDIVIPMSTNTYGVPSFCDIDADGDFDLFVGCDEQLSFCPNIGTPFVPAWGSVESNYAGVVHPATTNEYDASTGAPAFIDVDQDGDYDLLIGSANEDYEGQVALYRNTGTPTNASWEYVTSNYFDTVMGDRTVPAACDLDGDGDQDCLVGGHSGGLYYFRNNNPNLLLSPSALTSVAGGIHSFQVSGHSGDLTFSLLQNSSGGELISTNEEILSYAAGDVSGGMDVIEVRDASNRIARAYINVIDEDDVSAAGKAVIIAGRNSSGDALWPAADYLADKAYNTLRYKGFSSSNICYLSHDRNEDVDNNGWVDDVDDDATWTQAENALTAWSGESDKLFLYIVDHGGTTDGSGYVRLSSSEVLTAVDLDRWLDDLQDEYGTEVTVVLDFCYSGSFMDELTYDGEARRVVVASCSENELSYYLADGAVSFSDIFLTSLLGGSSVGDAYESARDAMAVYQSAQMDDDDNGLFDDADGTTASSIIVGESFSVGREAPNIGSISPNQTVSGDSSVSLWVDNLDAAYPIDRVWCVIIPPDFVESASESDMANLPELDLAYSINANRYVTETDGFNEEGTYKIIFYAQDVWGGVSLPKQSYITQSDYDERAILVAGGATNDTYWSEINRIAETAYQTFLARAFDEDHIYYLSASGDADAPAQAATVVSAVTNWAQEADKLTVYLVGQGATGTVRLSATENLSATSLDAALDAFQEQDRSVNVLVDSDYAGIFISLLQPPPDRERILIAGTKTNQVAQWDVDGLANFSQFFLSGIFEGRTIGDAFAVARTAIRLATMPYRQDAQLNDNGNAIANEKNSDGELAEWRYIGSPFVTGSEWPSIGSVTEDTVFSDDEDVTLWAAGVVGDISAVRCLITSSSGETTDALLAWSDETERYEGVYTFDAANVYICTFIAEDAEGRYSAPMQTCLASPLWAPVDEAGKFLDDARDEELAGFSLDERDFDEDGFNNANEYYSGTDPRDASSVFAFDQLQRSEGLTTLSWPVETGRQYYVLRQDSLLDSVWDLMGGPWEATNNQTYMEWTDTNACDACFYRIEINHP